MSVLQVRGMSDILAGTGEAGMEAQAGQRFWSWRRIVLTAGYGLVFLAGLQILVAADPNGLILMVAAVAGVLFLHRNWLGVVVWTYVLLSGVVALVSGDDSGFYGVVGGIGFGLIALPIWSPRRKAPRATYWPIQSPFAPPPTPPDPTPAVDPQLAATPLPVVLASDGAQTAVRPMIRTIGRIQALTSAGDFTASLMGKPVVGFLWLYLLARSVRKPGDRVTRTAITDEVAHGVSDPRGRLRGYLRDLSHLPAPLGPMVKVQDELIGFDLDGCEADFALLRTLADNVRQTGGSLDSDSLGRAQALLIELGDGEFLPGFEDMEKRVTQGRGVAGQIVSEVRAQIDTMRADLAEAVAKALLDRGQPALAVALLDPLVARSEERDDLARTLINALRESGQNARAAEIRRRFAVGQES